VCVFVCVQYSSEFILPLYVVNAAHTGSVLSQWHPSRCSVLMNSDEDHRTGSVAGCVCPQANNVLLMRPSHECRQKSVSNK